MPTDRATESPPRVPQPRSPGLDFSGVPRHWLGDNAFATHLANGVNLLFPAGERFFVRSVRRYLDRVEDPALRARIRGFFGQEGRHAHEHEHAIRVLEEQGFEVRRFLRAYEKLAFGIIERAAPPGLRLATTAACEHFTAIMAENTLREGLLDRAHPTMRALLSWHAAEEIEHRAVAFDVLSLVRPGYGLRVAGMAVASVLLAGFWLAGMATLLAQEKLPPGRLRADLRAARAHRTEREVFARGIREYLRRGFHPSQKDIDHLAARYLAQAGLA